MLSDDLISGAKKAGEYLGLTTRTVYHMVEAGHLPCTRKGKSMYFRKTELDAAFKSQAVS